MKILLIHGDVFPWATTFRAEEFKKRWTDDEVDIMFYEHVYNKDLSSYDIIHLLFSGGMTMVENVITKHKEKIFTSVASERTLDGVYDGLDHLKRLYGLSRGIVAQNKRLQERTIAMIGEEHAHKVHYIPNGVNTDMFDKPFVVGFVGNRQAGVDDHKGYLLIEKACESLGLTLKCLKDTYAECRVSHTEMPDFYNTIDCLVLASASEGCNNPTLEALAMNIPVITTNVGIASELPVTLVERNVDSIIEGIKKVYTRHEILKNYTWDKIASQYHQLYEKN